MRAIAFIVITFVLLMIAYAFLCALFGLIIHDSSLKDWWEDFKFTMRFNIRHIQWVALFFFGVSVAGYLICQF